MTPRTHALRQARTHARMEMGGKEEEEEEEEQGESQFISSA